MQKLQTQNIFFTPPRKAEFDNVPPKINGKPFPANAPYSELLHESEQMQVDSITEQTCFSKNFENPEKISENKISVFISFDNYVYPCCMIGSNVAQSKTSIFEGGPINSILNKINSTGEEAFSVENKTLKQVLDSGVLNTTYFDNIENNADAFCKLTCGKCDNNKYKVV